MLRKLSIGVALFTLLISILLYGAHYGFDQGVLAAALDEKIKLALYGIKEISFGVHGPRTYEFLSDRYFHISCFLVLYLLSKFIKYELISQIVCIALLGFTIYEFWQIQGLYSLLTENSDYKSTAHFILLRDTIPLILINFLFVLSLLIIQIIIGSKSLYGKYKGMPK